MPKGYPLEWPDRCGKCGEYGCYGTCQEPTRATENDVDDEEIEPRDGDSYDDARWLTIQEWADNDEGGQA